VKNKNLNKELIDGIFRQTEFDNINSTGVIPLTVGDNVSPLTVGEPLRSDIFTGGDLGFPLKNPNPLAGPGLSGLNQPINVYDSDFWDRFLKNHTGGPSINTQLSEEEILEAVKTLGIKKFLKLIPRKALLEFLKEDVPET